MKNIINVITSFALIGANILGAALPATAQRTNENPKTSSKILYHGGRVLTGPADIYFIWYGCWTNNCGANGSADTTAMLTIFASNVGATDYSAINIGYPNTNGQHTSGALVYGGSAYDTNYSHGVELSVDDIEAIVTDQVESHHLPQDPNGIYVVVASADVGSTETGLCSVPGVPFLHGNAVAFFSDTRYAFLGNPARCPAIAAPQFVAASGTLLPTPNNDLAGDALATDLANVVSTTITNPWGDGWFDRYGLQNADKCRGTFGQTFATTNGARANVHWGQRDYLIQQNWVNDRKGRCALSQ